MSIKKLLVTYILLTIQAILIIYPVAAFGSVNEVSFSAPGATITLGLTGQNYPSFSERFSQQSGKCLDTADEDLLNDVIGFIRSNVATNPTFPQSFWLCQNSRTRNSRMAPVLRVSSPKKAKGLVYDIGVEGMNSKHSSIIVNYQ